MVLFLTLEVVLFLTLERLKRGTKTNSPAYIYIYIWLWARLPPQILPFLAFVPQLCSKKWPKRDVANLPHLSIYVFDKNSPKMAWDCSPKHFLKTRTLGPQSQAFFLVHLGFKVNFFAYLAKKTL